MDCLKNWRFNRLGAFGVSALMSLQIFSVSAAETVFGNTFDSCVRFPNGKINFCIRNGEKWYLFKEDFVKYTHLSNNRWRICIAASPDFALLSLPVSTLLDIEVNCSTRTLEALKGASYKKGFCEGRLDNPTNYKRGQLVIPVVSETDPFGFLNLLACQKGSNQAKISKKNVAKSQEPNAKKIRRVELPPLWYVNIPKYCSDSEKYVNRCEKEGDANACYFAGLIYYPHRFSYESPSYQTF